MADHGDAPIVAQDLGQNHPGVFGIAWSKEFNGRVPEDAAGYEEVWVFSRRGLEPTPTSSLEETISPVVVSSGTFDLDL
jgi:hypothetical protein